MSLEQNADGFLAPLRRCHLAQLPSASQIGDHQWGLHLCLGQLRPRGYRLSAQQLVSLRRQDLNC